MPIKSIKKVIWFCTSFLSLGLCAVIFFTFFTAEVDAQKVPELPAPPTRAKAEITLNDYKSIWETQVNTDPPIVRRPDRPVTIKKAEPKFADIIPRYVSIHSILSNTLAILVDQQKRETRHMRPFDQEIENKFQDQGDDSQRPWEINIAGKKAMIKKIDINKGIFFVSGEKEGWLELKSQQSTNNLINKLPPRRKLGENHWVVTRDEARKMYENYDQYIRELGLKTHENGIWVRRVPEESQAAFYGLRPDDIVVDFNGIPLKYEQFSSKKKLRLLAKKHKRVRNFYINVLRNGRKVKLRFDRPR